MFISDFLYIADSEKGGRGVFTKKNIAEGTTIEISPVLVFNVKDRHLIEKTYLTNYVFEWGNSKRLRALGMGYISMYNHSYDANCQYEMYYEHNNMHIITVKPIAKGQELFINYNGWPDNKKLVWFDAK